MQHYIFGSKSSIDYDILVIQNSIPNIQDCKKIVENLEPTFKNLYPDKPINLNLGVIEENTISKVYKGTPDEVNNAIIATYNLHPQKFPHSLIPVERNIDLKIVRAVRIMLGFLSRTKYRDIVKAALKSEDLDKRLWTLNYINLEKIDNFGKKQSIQDIFKTFAFQIGQTWLLIDGIEVYTKEDIIENYPKTAFEQFLKRSSDNKYLMNYIKDDFINRIKEYRPKMKLLVEELRE